MEELNLNKMIKKVAISTIIVLILLFGAFIGIFTLFYPSTLANWASSLGLKNVAIFYYEKTYEQSQDVNDLYLLLNESILANKTQKIITNFEKLYDNNSQNYNNFIDYMNDYYMSSTNNVILQTFLTSEDLRLKQHYIQALFEVEEQEKAFLFVINDLNNEQFLTINDYNNLNFLGMMYFFELNKISLDKVYYEKFESYFVNSVEVNYLQNAMDYYNDIKDIYEFNLFTREANENSFELNIICKHLLGVATTLIQIDNILENEIDTTMLENHLIDYSAQFEQLLDELEMLQQFE